MSWRLVPFLFAPALLAQSTSSQGVEFFESKVRPIFATQCSGCHGGASPRGGLVLGTPEGIAKGGDSGAILNKTNPDESRLLQVISYHSNIKMPPTGKLKDQQIADITEWVKAGAPMPGGSAVISSAPAPGAKKKEFTKRQKEWWSFQAIQNPKVPEVQNKAWVKDPIDAFVLSKLESKGLTPAKPADKIALIRRATFDLTGLPPTEKEILDFVDDRSPGAFAKVVDRLLASPRYGERWGRHWLDVARYADSTGADEDHRYPYAYRYRDYVIQAFNKDLPYDQFVREQIAGDLLPAKDGKVNRDGIIATGFLSVGPRLIAEQDKPKMLYDFIDEQIDVTTRAFMGLTVGCARCHDHKFDPILQKDYYSLAAIFANTKGFKKIGDGGVSQMYFAPLVDKPVADAYEAHQTKLASKKREMDILVEEQQEVYFARYAPKLADYMAAAFRICHEGESEEKLAEKLQLDPAILRKWLEYLPGNAENRPHMAGWYKADRKNLQAVIASFVTEYQKGQRLWEEALDKWKVKVAKANADGKTPPDRPRSKEARSRFFSEVVSGPFALEAKERQKIWPADVWAKYKQLEGEYAQLKKSSPPEPEMANAVTENDQYVEQHLFIRGDVHNPGEVVPRRFPVILAGENQASIEKGSGRIELADWLVRKDHPLTSRVFVNRVWQWHFGEGLMRTPSNWGLMGERPTHPELLDFLAQRFMEKGWSVKQLHREIMLSSTYQMSSEITKEQSEKDAANRLWSRFPRRRLDVEEIRDGMLALDGTLDYTMGGTLQKGFGTDGENAEGRMSIKPEKEKRRTVYLPLRRSNLPTLLNLFDFGDATTTGEGRANTNVAPQALFMMNSNFVTECAKTLASQIHTIEDAYVHVLNRKPSKDEVSSVNDYIQSVAAKRSQPAAWESFFRILLSSNEFIYVD